MSDAPPPVQKSPKGNLSKKQQRVIGFAVLLLGFLAFAGVSWLAYTYYFSEEAQIEIAQKKRQKEIQKRIKSGDIKTLSVRPKSAQKPVNQKLMALKSQPRQPKIKFGVMDGKWIANSIDGIILLKIGRDSKYRIVFINDGESGSRLYSEGTFSKRGDVLYFKPNKDFRPPKTIKGKRINSRRLTGSPFPVMVAKHGENIIWTRPTRAVSKAAKVFTPNKHAVLNKVEDEIVVWKRMK